jgi:hypothetical protein
MNAPIRFSVGLLLALCVLAGTTAAPASAKRSVTFGAWTPGSPFGGKLASVNRLQRTLGRRVKIVNWYQDWSPSDRQHFSYNVTRAVRGVLRSHRRPMLTWEPYPLAGGAPWEDYSNDAIASGRYDGFIRNWAAGVARLRKPVYVRFAHEFNGNWYPWGGVVNDNSPASFKRMWTHVVDVARGAGARNIRWVWSPLADKVAGTPRFEAYWPGKRYVDVMGLSGFNWGASVPQYGGWRTFRKIFKKPYRRIARLSRKPIWITEIGSASDGGSKYRWVRNMFKTVSNWDRLRAIVWYDQDKERDWSTASAASAFKD